MRVALAIVACAGLAALVLLTAPGSFLIAMPAIALGFLLAGAKAAVDLIELLPAELAADAVGFAALGLALTRITAGTAVLPAALLALALAAQGIPLAVRMARCPHRSTSPRMPPGSA
jgi:hypothetical protein